MPRTSREGLIVNQSAKSDASAKSSNSSAVKYAGEFTRWREKLKEYWLQIDKNQELYEFHKRRHEEGESNLSLNTPFAIIESMVAKANEATVNVTVRAKGKNNLKDLESWVSSILTQAIEDPDVAQFHGSFRKIKEGFFREFLVKGNAIASVNWCYKTVIIDGVKKVVADNPYIKLVPFKSVIFNPSKTLSSSDVYYIESYVSYAQLKNQEYDKKEEKGLYKNLGKLKEYADKAGKVIDHKEDTYISGDKKITRQVEPIHILERWENGKLTVIADKQVIIREEYDPMKIGGHNLITAMNYIIEGRPYAYGEIDAIYKPVLAQDTIINQNIDMINRYLRPGFILNSGSSIDPHQFARLIQEGGVISGQVQNSFAPISRELPVPPAQAFTQINLLQQGIERAARFSPYATGIPSAQTDKTQGTMGGIRSLQQAAEPNFQIKLDALQDCFMRPVARAYLTMIANHMDERDIRYGLLQGKNAGWVKATKSLLQGKTSLNNLITEGIIDEEDALPYITTIIDTVDEMGRPIQDIVEIPGARDALIFDIDWVIDVKLDNQAAFDKDREFQQELALIQFGMQLQVPLDPIKTFIRLARSQGIDDIEELIQQQPPMSQGIEGMPGMPQEEGMPMGQEMTL